MTRARISRAAIAVVVGCLACDHSTPFAVDPPAPAGPWTDRPPIRLTFNPAEDRDPAATDSFIVFSRLELGRADRDRCLAFLPIDGGTLLRETCPGGARPDNQLDAWLQPAPTSDGRIAFVHQTSSILSLSPGVREIAIAPIDAPDSTVISRSIGGMTFEGERVLDLRQLAWVAENRVRFIAGIESLTVTPGTSVYDTVFAPLGLAQLDLGGGDLVPLAAGAKTHTAAPDGEWYVRSSDPRTLWHIAEGAPAPDSVGVFSGPVGALGSVNGVPVATILDSDPALIEWLDLATGMPGGVLDVFVNARLEEIAGIPGTTRAVVAYRLGVAPSDLALVERP